MTETKANYVQKLLAADYYGLTDSTSKFDRDSFVQSKVKLNKLEETLTNLSQKPNRENQRAAGLELMRNSEYFIKMRNGSGIAQDVLSDVVKYGSSEMVGYSINNQKEMYGVLGTKDKLDLISSGSVAKMTVSKKDEKPNEAKAKYMEEYNNFAEASNLRSDLLRIDVDFEQEEAYEKKAAFMAEQLKYSPRWFAAAMLNQSENRDFVEAINKEYITRLEVGMNQTLSNDKGEMDDKKIGKFADTNHNLQVGFEEKNSIYFTGLNNIAYNASVRQILEEAEKAKEKQLKQAA